MLVQEKRRRVMNDLSPLATAEPAEILKAFQIFGAFETTFVETYTAQAPSLQLKNPQSEIFQPFNQNMGQAIHAVLKGTQAPENLPDPNDRMYLNALLTTRVSAGQEYDQQTAAAERLVGYALDQSDRNPEMTVEQELRCAGLLALACRILPDGDIFLVMSQIIRCTSIFRGRMRVACCGSRKSINRFSRMQTMPITLPIFRNGGKRLRACPANWRVCKRVLRNRKRAAWNCSPSPSNWRSRYTTMIWHAKWRPSSRTICLP